MIHPATLQALGSKSFEWLVLVRFELDEGAIAFSNQFDALSFEGFEYQPFGNLGDISPIEKSLNLDPQWMDITISGVRAEILQAALSSNYSNRPAYVHLGTISDGNGSYGIPWRDEALAWSDESLSWSEGGDRPGEIIGEPFLYFAGKIDQMDCTYSDISEITVRCADELSDWERPKIERYTDQDQQAKYPGDKGFEFVAQVDTKEVVWPAREWFTSRA